MVIIPKILFKKLSPHALPLLCYFPTLRCCQMYRPLSAFAVRILTPIMLPPLYNGVNVWIHELAILSPCACNVLPQWPKRLKTQKKFTGSKIGAIFWQITSRVTTKNLKIGQRGNFEKFAFWCFGAVFGCFCLFGPLSSFFWGGLIYFLVGRHNGRWPRVNFHFCTFSVLPFFGRFLQFWAVFAFSVFILHF